MDKIAKQVAIGAVAVMVAGYVMKQFRGSVKVIADASDGFDT